MAATTRVHDTSAIRAKLLEKMGELATDNFPEAIAQNFPHILARLADLWGSAALDAYLDELMLARIFHKTGRISLNPLIKLGLRQ